MIFVSFIIIYTAYIFTIIYTYFECSLLDLGVGFGWGQTFPTFHVAICALLLMHAFQSYPDYNADYNAHHFLPTLHCGTHLPYCIYLFINYKLSVSNIFAYLPKLTSI